MEGAQILGRLLPGSAVPALTPRVSWLAGVRTVGWMSAVGPGLSVACPWGEGDLFCALQAFFEQEQQA